ncbi:MAG: peptidylprolyl isomerase [Bacteroidales bacterium]
MKYIQKVLIVVALIICSTSVNAQVYHDGLVDKTVALIGADMVQLSQIESEVQMRRFNGYVSDQNLRCEILEQMLVSKLFLTQARLDSLNVNPDQVQASLDDRLNNVLTQLGGEKAAEKYFGKNMYQLKKEWSTTIKEQLLIQQMQQKVSGAAQEMTPKEVYKYYKSLPKDSLPVISTKYKISQIAIYPDRKKASLAVKAKLLDFRKRIMNGEKFEMLATLYSEDPGSSMKGGELGMASKSIFWPAFSDAAMSLKVGQVSPIVETPDGFHLIKMIKKDGDMFDVRHILLKPKYTEEDRKKAFAKLDSIKTLITEDSLTFYDAARYFSEDTKTRTDGGQVADERTGDIFFEKDKLKPTDYAILKDMKVGDISEPFQSSDNEGRNGNTFYKIVKLDEIIPSHVANYDKDLYVLKNMAENKQSNDAIEKFIKEKQALTYIVIDPLFQNCNFKRSGWIK